MNSETWEGGTKICISLTPLPLSVGTQWLLFFGSDVGPLWLQGLEGSSVSIGCEIRKLRKGDENMPLSFTLLPLSVGFRCGTIMVARLRRNFCQYRM